MAASAGPPRSMTAAIVPRATDVPAIRAILLDLTLLNMRVPFGERETPNFPGRRTPGRGVLERYAKRPIQVTSRSCQQPDISASGHTEIALGALLNLTRASCELEIRPTARVAALVGHEIAVPQVGKLLPRADDRTGPLNVCAEITDRPSVLPSRV